MLGQIFNSWTITGIGLRNKKGELAVLCRCKCGREKEVKYSSLKRGSSRQCHGCAFRNNLIKHNLSRSPIYMTWRCMIRRCSEPKVNGYKNYGGRGIKVCERWLKFENFLEDMGQRPFPEAQLDRIDTNGNYEKSNCRWVTREQNRTNRRCSK